jgi:hypothetical protein
MHVIEDVPTENTPSTLTADTYIKIYPNVTVTSTNSSSMFTLSTFDLTIEGPGKIDWTPLASVPYVDGSTTTKLTMICMEYENNGSTAKTSLSDTNMDLKHVTITTANVDGSGIILATGTTSRLDHCTVIGGGSLSSNMIEAANGYAKVTELCIETTTLTGTGEFLLLKNINIQGLELNTTLGAGNLSIILNDNVQINGLYVISAGAAIDMVVNGTTSTQVQQVRGLGDVTGADVERFIITDGDVNSITLTGTSECNEISGLIIPAGVSVTGNYNNIVRNKIGALGAGGGIITITIGSGSNHNHIADNFFDSKPITTGSTNTTFSGNHLY